jgi:energy-coupling factor transport system ATP-binding protein
MIPITIENLMFAYPSGVAALNNVSLLIAPGESVALIGQNGAGKTTLARHLNGLLKPTAGDVRIGDWSTRDHSVAQLARRVGYVFQQPEHQIFKRTVRDEVAFGPRNLGYDEQKAAALIDAALHRTNLTAHATEHPHDLMPSLRKLVTIAAVLAMDTPIVVLDEPTTGQDAAGVRRIGSIIRDLIDTGRTVITISHDIDFCADYCERFVVMSQGRVLLDGAPRDVFAKPDLLAQAAVEPPQLTRLAQRLDLPTVWQVGPLLDALNVPRSAS